MVGWTVDKISGLADPGELSASEKDDIYEALAWLQPGEVKEAELARLFLVAREVMKYKGEQVESLLADLDILASNAGGGNEELQEEFSKATKQIKELMAEVEAKDRELEDEKNHVEKLLSEMGELQKEKAELKREMLLIQSEAAMSAGHGVSLGDDSSEDTAQLKEMIQSKNKHILQLLSDIQILEKENEIINNKITSLRQEATEATTNLTKYSGENISLRQTNEELQEKVVILEERNGALASQVSELVEERNKREGRLDELIDALDERVSKWQEILSQKDEEVQELRAKLSEAIENSAPKGSMMFSANYMELTKTIEDQEEAIKQLHEQLKNATEDMSNCSIQVQELKQKAQSTGASHRTRDPEENGSKTIEELKEALEKSQAQIHYLQEKVNDAEQDAQFRAEEMTELIIQLKEYEEGIYGLPEARNQVKELKKQLKTRDNQILKLIEQINHLTLQNGSGEQIDVENFERYFEDEEKMNHMDLQTQLSAIQQTAINLSMQNFALRAQIVKMKEDQKKFGEEKSIAPEQTETKENKETEEKLKAAIEENESLRKGLHEILESIQSQDGSTGTVVIESDCLERLLEALDARHVAGWYHPAMRIQAALNKMQGNNDALRQELRESRLRESYFQAELQTAMIQIEELQGEIKKYLAAQQMPPIPAPRTQVSEKATQEVTDTGDGGMTPTDAKAEEVMQEDRQVKRETQEGSTQTDPPPPRETSEKSILTELTSHQIAILIREGKPDIVHDENDNKVPVKDDLKPLKESEAGDGDMAKKEGTTTKENGSKVAREESEETDSSGSPRLKHKLEEIEKGLRKKCEDLKSEFDSIKKTNEQALQELQKNKQEMFSEVEKAMIKVSAELKSMKDVESSKPAINEFTLGAFKEQEAKLLSYGIELGELRRGITEKENYIKFLEVKITETNAQAKENIIRHQEHEEKRIKTLKETINGLQQIITQKENTVQRYKELLEESNNEYGQLLQKYHCMEKNVHVTSMPRDPIAESKSVSILMEKWIERVRGLESEIDHLNNKLLETSTNLEMAQREAQDWRTYAEDLQAKSINEELAKSNRKEIEELRLHIKELKEEAEISFQNRIKNDNAKFKAKEEEYKQQIKNLESDIARLKHQLSIRSSKSITKTHKKEILLIEKVKGLEEELEKCRERERLQLQLKREKTEEEVSKWEERKRLQSTVEKLKAEVRDKSQLIEQLEGQSSRLKVIIARMERERISLQRRLKSQTSLLAKTMSEEGKRHDFDDKPYETDSRFETPVPDITPRSPAESIASELHDPKIKNQSRRDLVKAITALKKVISRLRAEHSNYYHKDYVEQLQNELRKMENNYMDAVERALALEEQLRESEAKICGQTYIVGGSEERSEVAFLKDALAQKCSLLMKVKVLLQRALLREKQLIHQVTLLEKLVPPEKLVRLHEEAREM